MKVCKKVDCIHYSNNLKCGLHDEDCKNYSNYNSYGYHNYDEIVTRFLECEEELQTVKKQLKQHKRLREENKQLKSEQNKVAVEKLEELRARFDNSPIIFFHDTELNEKERAIVRDEYEDAKFIFRDNIDQLLAELKGESDD